MISRYGAKALLETGDGKIVRATSRRKLQNLVCGDHVEWQEQQRDIIISKMLPRKNSLTRSYFRGTPRTIAANIDQIIIISAVQPTPDWNIVDRLFVTAAVLQVDAILLHHKCDLPCPDGIAAIYAEYEEIGYPVLKTSTHRPDSLIPLQQQLNHKTSILVGQSGMGKSSLTNRLIPEADILTQTLSDTTGFGQHTTSNARLYHLPAGGALIDSPGIRDFTPPPIPPAEVQRGFIEIQALRDQCRFHNCMHINEPGCAVKAAVQNGDILARRYDAYLVLVEQQTETGGD